MESLDERMKFYDAFIKQAKDLMLKKAADYSGQDDCNRNFKASESLGIDASTSIMVRLTDKFCRLGKLLKQDPKTIEESFKDTCIDIVNYVVVLADIERVKKEGNLI